MTIMFLSFFFLLFSVPDIFTPGVMNLPDETGSGRAWAGMQRDILKLELSDGSIKPLSVELAQSNEEKALGLMFRTELTDGQGMLFVYDSERIITMWMKNTYIPLDMVFIGARGAVVHIAQMTEPFSEEIISSQKPAQYVLEIAGGAAKRFGLKVGDRVRHRLISLDK